MKLLWVIVAVAALIPAGILAFWLYDKWTQWLFVNSPAYREKLAAEWDETTATITAMEKTRDGYAIRFRYHDPVGEPHELTEELMEDECPGWKVGRGITVSLKRKSPGEAIIDV